MESRKSWRACVAVCMWVLMFIARVDSSPDNVTRGGFPAGFIFGTASSSYQYEGAARQGGRGPSIWDTFSHLPGKIENGSDGDVSVDQYHRYEEDVQLMDDMGMDAYRFSISWSRLLPKGTLNGGLNLDGLAYYNNLINELLDNDIKPFVTLFHWDLPQALEDSYGGFLSQNIVADFVAYAEVCFQVFGDRVKHWITLNEPYSYAYEGYDLGTFAPGRYSTYDGSANTGNSSTEPYIVAHNLLLSHAEAVRLYKDKYQANQNGSIGITLVSHWVMPYSEEPADRLAAGRALDFMFGWFMNPLTRGEYPESMRLLVGERLPKFIEDQSNRVKGSFDFVGLNYYTARYAASDDRPIDPTYLTYSQDSRVRLSTDRDGVQIGPRAASNWLYVYPPGIRALLNYTKNQYNNPPIFITENGIDEINDDNIALREQLNDTWRIDYYKDHLSNVQEAISDGSDVRGYFAWSLLDNFEWIDGYSVRFGLIYVDFDKNLYRYHKASSFWFTTLLK